MSMDQSTGQERERIVQDERAAARNRVQAAQDQEVAKRAEVVEQRVEQQRRAIDQARERRRAAVAAAARAPVERDAEGDNSPTAEGATR